MAGAGVGRVVVGVSGSLGNLAALHAAAEQARGRGVPLMAVLAWRPVGGEVAYHRAPCPALLEVWEQDAVDRLNAAVVDAFGGLPAAVAFKAVVVRAAPGPALVVLAGRSDDLLVVGAGRRGQLTRVWHGAVCRYCLAHARCPVLAVPQPELISELRHRRIRVRSRDLAGLDQAIG